MIDDRGSALLMVDVQNDFCPGGALAVPEGDHVVPPLNRAAARFSAVGLPVYASRDWHPLDSMHFEQNGGTWPEHCVQGTPGARLHPDLQLPPNTMIVTKGTDRTDDGYSAMEGRVAGRETLLEDLAARGVTHLYVGGLATDYCVKRSVLDALAQGIRVTVLDDAIRAVNLNPEDGQQAIAQMKAAGATFEPSVALLDAESTPR